MTIKKAQIQAMIDDGMKLVPFVKGEKKPIGQISEKACGIKWTNRTGWTPKTVFLVDPRSDAKHDIAVACYDPILIERSSNMMSNESINYDPNNPLETHYDGTMGVDVDGGEKMQKWLRSQIWWTDGGKIVKTPGKGFHHYFRIKQPLKGIDGLHFPGTPASYKMDIKGNNGTLQCWGSTHKNGGIYELIKDEEIVEIPKEMLDKIIEMIDEKRPPQNNSSVSFGNTITSSGKIKPIENTGEIKEGDRNVTMAEKIIYPLGMNTRLAPEDIAKIALDYNARLFSPMLEEKTILDMVAEVPRQALMNGRKNDAKWIPNDSNNVINIEDAFAAHGLTFRWNSRAVKIEVSKDGKTWDQMEDDEWDSFFIRITRDTYIGGYWKEGQIRVPRTLKVQSLMVSKSIKEQASVAKVDPFQVWIDELPKWDGVKRIENIVTTLWKTTSDPALVKFSYQSLLVGCIKRMRKPGAKHDTMLVLTGGQGIGKSTNFSNLLPRSEWFTDSVDFRHTLKELSEAMEGIVISEFSELSGMDKTENGKLLKFLSSMADKLRRAYGRGSLHFKRYGCCVGTSNEKFALSANTDGNRRYIPIAVESNGKDNSQWIIDNREQIWAEADWMDKNGHSNKVPDELVQIQIAACEGSSRRNLVIESLDEKLEDNPFNTYRTRTLCGFVGVKFPNSNQLTMASQALKRAGYISYRMRESVDGITQRPTMFLHQQYFCEATGLSLEKRNELMEKQGIALIDTTIVFRDGSDKDEDGKGM